MKIFATADHEFNIDDDWPLTFGLKRLLRGLTYINGTGSRQYFVKSEKGEYSINIDGMDFYIYKQEKE